MKHVKHEIRDRYSNACLYVAKIDDATPEADRTKRAVENAVAAGANLAGAYLAGAYLAGANLDRANLDRAYLAGANLVGANLAGANLVGAYLDKDKYGTIEAIFQLGPMGSRNAMLVLFRCTKTTVVRAGCFTGTVAEFVAAVKKTHGKSRHAKDYAAALAFVEALWRKKKPEPKETR